MLWKERGRQQEELRLRPPNSALISSQQHGNQISCQEGSRLAMVYQQSCQS